MTYSGIALQARQHGDDPERLGAADLCDAQSVCGAHFAKSTQLRLDVLNASDSVHEVRNGTGVGVGAPQYGMRHTTLAGLTQRF